MNSFLKSIKKSLFLPVLLSCGITQAQNALSFDGGDYVKIPAYSAVNTIGTGNFTIEARVKASSSQTGTYPAIFSNRGSNSSGIILFLHTGSPYNGRPWVNIQGINYPCSTCPSLTDNTAHAIAVNRNNDSLHFYIDGSYVFGRPIATPGNNISDTANIRIGHDLPNSSSCFFTGEIAETRVWNLARTSSEIAASYNKTLYGSSYGLVGYWRLNEGTGQTVYSHALSYLNHGTRGYNTTTETSDPTWVSGTSTGITKITGSAFENPISAGTIGIGGAFNDVQNNSTSNNFDNDLGQETDDIVYSFTIAQNSLVTINNCNSAIVDTYLRLYNTNRTLIQLNDDYGYNGTICSNNLNSSIRINLIPGTYFVASEGYSNSYVGNIITSIAVAAYDATYGAATGRQEAIEDVVSHNKAAVEEVMAYPNPVKDGTVYFGRTAENYTLINSAGEAIFRGTHANKLNVEGIAPGLYFLKMDQKTEKIIVE